jgi:hypothetical protein
MSSFHTVALVDQCRANFEKEMKEKKDDPRTMRLARWIQEECSHSPFLREVGLALLRERQNMPFDRQALEMEVGNRSDAYYSQLWSTLTGGERLALYQLAKDGWANPKNDRALQQLQRKGVVRVAPMLQIMNETFRLFTRKAQDENEIAVWEQRAKQSTWRTVKFSLLSTAIALAAWLFYAQKDLFLGAIGYVVALGAAVTAVGNLIGGIRGRPGTPPQSPDAAA